MEVSSAMKRFKNGEQMVTEATLMCCGSTYQVKLRKEQYGANGALALTAVDAGTGEPLATLSVNIVDKDCALQSKKLPKGHCFFKTWSENEGFLEQLEAQKLVQNLGVRHQATGAPIVKILF